MICKIAYIFLFIICSNVSLLWGQTFVFRGTVLDEQTHKALDYATVQLFVDKQIVYGGNKQMRMDILNFYISILELIGLLYPI